MYTLRFDTEILFGKGSIESLSKKLKEINPSKVMITYGGGSVKRNKIFDAAVEQIEKAEIEWIEFGGIEPNPRHSTIDKAAEEAKSKDVDFILAIGGGSTIDASKVIAAKMTNDWNSCWDYVKEKVSMTESPINLGAIITLAGTASENNAGSVITNDDVKEKLACMTKSPLFAIEDPTYTFTVNKWQTACGSFDAFSHLLEQFFGAKKFDFTDNMIIGMLKTIINNTPKAIENPNDYEARESLLINSSFALNRLLAFKPEGDWFVHGLEHALSAIWDISHGAGLATISYYYYEEMINISDDYRERAALLAKELFNKDKAEDFIVELRKFIDVINLPNKLKDYESISSVSEEDISKMIEHVQYRGTDSMNEEQIKNLIRRMI